MSSHKTVSLNAGQSLDIVLPNGVTLNVEVTDDYIQIVDDNGNKVYGAVKAPVTGDWLEEERIPGTPIEDIDEETISRAEYEQEREAEIRHWTKGRYEQSDHGDTGSHNA